MPYVSACTPGPNKPACYTDLLRIYTRGIGARDV